MHNQHRSPDPTKIERATATSTVALFIFFLLTRDLRASEIITTQAVKNTPRTNQGKGATLVINLLHHKEK
jgi:hypothetical protein